MKKLYTLIAILFAGYAAIGQCNPSFTYSQSPSNNDLLNVSFSNTTSFTPSPGDTGQQVTYSYNYGDGSSDGYGNHSYATTGSYLVTLSMSVCYVDSTIDTTTTALLCSNTYSQNITVANTTCGTTVSSLPLSNTSTSETITFSANTPAGASGMTYNWDFGDGTNGPGVTANHTYTSSGSYYVNMSATNGSCAYTNYVYQEISILNCDSLFSNFTYSGYYNDVYFTSTSTTDYPVSESYSWDFGDGTTSTEYAPTHAYATPGTYNVGLTTTWTDDSLPTVGTCNNTITHSVTVNNVPNKIAGYIVYNDSAYLTSNENMLKVWLIQLNGNILTAVDSLIDTNYYSNSAYEFDNEPTGIYMTKAQLLTNNVAGVTGYVPTYATASLYWSGAYNIHHTGGDDENIGIVMQAGTVSNGPGFIAGNVLSGANKGTDAGIPAMGMLIYLRSTGSTNVAAYQFTDVDGNYTFSNIPTGSYNIYPEAAGYATTPYPDFTVTTGQATVNSVNFRQHTTDKTITPVVSTAVGNVTANEMKLNVYPNPTNGQINIQWQVATTQNAHVSIANVVGQKVFESNMNFNAGIGNEKLDVSALKNGLYMMTIKSDNINYSQKLIIQH